MIYKDNLDTLLKKKEIKYLKAIWEIPEEILRLSKELNWPYPMHHALLYKLNDTILVAFGDGIKDYCMNILFIVPPEIYKELEKHE